MSLCSDPHVPHSQVSGRHVPTHPEKLLLWRWGNGEGAGLQPPDERPRESAEWGPALPGSPGPGGEGGGGGLISNAAYRPCCGAGHRSPTNVGGPSPALG